MRMSATASTPVLILFALGWATLASAPMLAEPFKLAGIAIAAALALLLHRGSLRLSAVLWLLLGVALACSLLALEPAQAWIGSMERAQGLLALAAAIVLAGMAADLNQTQRRSLISAVAALATCVSGYALLQRLGIDWLHWAHAEANRPAATLGNANALGGFLLLALPPTLLAAWRSPRPWLWRLAALLQLLGLWACGTRSAWLALPAALALAFVLARPQRWRILLALAGLPLALFLLAMLRPASLQDRAELWSASAHALWQAPPLQDLRGNADPHSGLRPLIGYGPDQQAAVLNHSRAATTSGRSETRGWQADRAHQYWLDLLLQRGIAGLAAALLLGAVVLRCAWRDWHQGRWTPQHSALALGLLAYAIHLQASFALTGDALLGWIWLGLVWSGLRGAAGGRAIPLPLRVLPAALLALGAITAVGLAPARIETALFPALASERHYLAGQSAYASAMSATAPAARIDLERAEAEFGRALALQRYDTDAALALAVAQTELAVRTADSQRAVQVRAQLPRLRRAGSDPHLLLQIEQRLDAAPPFTP